ncbi:heme lyase CcmF/NrfE family subunit [bacterium]|nr:heme lyase CcmF/NrfE family subunit [bacterium]
MSLTYLGEWAMRFDFAVAALGTLIGAVGLWKKNLACLEFQRRSLMLSSTLVFAATGILVYAFFVNDFSIRYVASYSSINLPAGYRLAALWAGQEGSQLFWLFVLAVYSSAYMAVHRIERGDIHFHATGFVLLAVQLFFLIIVNVASDPYTRLDSPPPDGNGLNPLLQHPAMAIHPPMLYTGFVGMTVPFACAMGALITGRLDAAWIKKCRVWTIFSWTILAIGIMLGGRWAYDELGWGGYWAWDPVENASFIPWLTATAFLHSVMIQERRGMLKIWNMSLISLTFLLTIFGTYMTRSGVVASVHSFARQPLLGGIFLAFIGLTAVFAFGLIVWRYPALKAEHRIESFLSREAVFLFNNVVLLGLAFAVLFGTMFPTFFEMVKGTRISVGPQFFNQVTIPLFLALLILTGIGPTIAWRKSSPGQLLKNFLAPLLGAALAVGLLWAGGVNQPKALAGIGSVVFVLGCLLLEFIRDTRARQRSTKESFLPALVRLMGKNRRRYGGYIIHAGVAVTALGIIASSSYQVHREAELGPGQEMRIERFRLIMRGLTEGRLPNATWVRATVDVFDAEKNIGRIFAEKRLYEKTEQPHTETGLISRVFYDFYVVLAGWTAEGAAILHVYVNPLVSWVWLGGAVLAAGAVLCLWPGKS